MHAHPVSFTAWDVVTTVPSPFRFTASFRAVAHALVSRSGGQRAAATRAAIRGSKGAASTTRSEEAREVVANGVWLEEGLVKGMQALGPSIERLGLLVHGRRSPTLSWDRRVVAVASPVCWREWQDDCCPFWLCSEEAGGSRMGNRGILSFEQSTCMENKGKETSRTERGACSRRTMG